jgi:starch synthase
MSPSRHPRVLFASAEAFPIAKTGGLGDVCGALPLMLARLGVDVRLIVPGYPDALAMVLEPRPLEPFIDPILGGARLVAGYMPNSGLPVLLFDAPRLFQRSGGLYQDAAGEDWSDNHRRFAAFSHAVARVALGCLPWRPDIVHANDWHTGLVPAILHEGGTARPKTIFTVHNLAFQGNFPLEIGPEIALRDDMISPDGVEFYGRVSFLKAGLRYSDRITTVSPTYAREILTPQHGCGMEGLLQARARDLSGILNGVDYDIWCPSKDVELPCRYTPEELGGKKACKTSLQQELRLSVRADTPLVIFVNRLTYQKMADAVVESIPALMAAGAQLVVHGDGERGIKARLDELCLRYPAQLVVRLGYGEALAHRLHAAADLALTPARFEPCGLTTMYAMRYGAIPVTRMVGGLADTVENVQATGDEHHGGTGFVFDEANAEKLTSSVRRAIDWFRSDGAWRLLQRRAMRRDFGWERSARRYLALYNEVLSPDAMGDRPATIPMRATA